jgi:hypothetical protein
MSGGIIARPRAFKSCFSESLGSANCFVSFSVTLIALFFLFGLIRRVVVTGGDDDFKLDCGFFERFDVGDVIVVDRLLVELSGRLVGLTSRILRLDVRDRGCSGSISSS